MAYLLDADVFIRAKRQHYGFDFCPAFWDWIIAASDNDKLFSVEMVRTELVAGSDDLSEWVRDRADGFFLGSNEHDIPSLRHVSEWAYNQNYNTSAIDNFFEAADYFLVVKALAGKHTIVTHEVSSKSYKKIKIPDACIALGINYMTPFEMLSRERAKFVLGSLQ